MKAPIWEELGFDTKHSELWEVDSVVILPIYYPDLKKGPILITTAFFCRIKSIKLLKARGIQLEIAELQRTDFLMSFFASIAPPIVFLHYFSIVVLQVCRNNFKTSQEFRSVVVVTMQCLQTRTIFSLSLQHHSHTSAAAMLRRV